MFGQYSKEFRIEKEEAMKKLLKTITIVLALMLVLSLAACAQEDTKETDPPKQETTATEAPADAEETQEQAQEPAEPVAVTMLMSGDNTPSKENDVLMAVQERTGYIMDVTYIAPADYETKLSSMIASRTLPDIISYDIVDGKEFKENDMIIELKALLAEYGPNISATHNDLVTGLNNADEVWGVPYGNVYASNLSVRKDWLDNLGMEMPTDLDSLYDALYAFTYDDPNGSGENDTIGIGIQMNINKTYSHIFGAYGIPLDNIQLADGTVTTYLRHENFVDAIMYIRKLYQEGLMESDFATIPVMDSFGKLWDGIYGMYDFQAVGTTNNWLGRYTEETLPVFDFAIISGPGGSGGCTQVYRSYYWGITTMCENPEAAMQLADYLTSEEGDELLYLGVEGVHYNWVDKEAGTYEMIAPYDDSATHRNAGAFVYWSYFAPNDGNAEHRTLNAQTRYSIELSQENFVPDAHIYSPLQAQADYGGTLDDIVKEAISQLIVTNGDVQAEYDAFVARWLAEGGEEFEAEATAVYAQENN